MKRSSSLASSPSVGAPTSDQHLTFLTNLETLLRTGRFTSTYKFALLLSMANLAVEQGNDSGAVVLIAGGVTLRTTSPVKVF